ncbi:hypothetical protein AGR1C_pAt40071 [Agrobacterium fabacearum TT111]|nr:hypothetical protein AGR1C_pAt40071 [Agrobacterium fabacearum TT111]
MRDVASVLITVALASIGLSRLYHVFNPRHIWDIAGGTS